ncbi:MAG TPA: hypothetical protein VHL09_09375, partial [Dehalococcoidia bacterium]|nr:hypothetical protein [Dehalococcoidia bacterium]
VGPGQVQPRDVEAVRRRARRTGWCRIPGSGFRDQSIVPGRSELGLGTRNSTRDSSVLTVAELDFSTCDEVIRDPTIRIVDHTELVGVPYVELLGRLTDLTRLWRLRRLVVDATGLG